MFPLVNPKTGDSYPYTLHYLGLLTAGEHWQVGVPPEEQAYAVEHEAYYWDLYDQKLVSMVGPIFDLTQGLFVFDPNNVTTWQQAEDLATGDPWVQHQIVQYLISAWQVVIPPAEPSPL